MNVQELIDLIDTVSVQDMIDQVTIPLDELKNISRSSDLSRDQQLVVKKLIHAIASEQVIAGENEYVNRLMDREAMYYDDRFNFTQYPLSPEIPERIRSTQLSRTFRVKYNQLERTQSEGYIIPDNELPILEDGWNGFIDLYESEIDSGSYQELLDACSNTYKKPNSNFSAMVVFITKAPKTAQISSGQIKDILATLSKRSEETDPINKLVIISNSKLTRSILSELNNHQYLWNSSGNQTYLMEPTDVFYFSELIVNKTHSIGVPSIETLTPEEEEDLLKTNNWSRDDLTVISHEDPLVKYLSIPEGKIIRIFRISNVRSAISRYSIFYRIVRAIPLFVSTKSAKDTRFVDQNYS